jgi:hemolysin activation/secretion protein
LLRASVLTIGGKVEAGLMWQQAPSQRKESWRTVVRLSPPRRRSFCNRGRVLRQGHDMHIRFEDGKRSMSPRQVILASALGAVLTQGVIAATPPAAGGAVQQIPHVPKLPRREPELRIEQVPAAAAPIAAGLRIAVDHLRVEGARAFAVPVLLKAIGFRPGARLNLDELDELAAKITAYYRARGYFVALAYFPPQHVEDGTVIVRVLEGIYGKVELRNRSALSSTLVRRLLGPVETGRLVEAQALERGLLLLSDLPGVDVKSTLLPGASVGSSNLIVGLAPGPRVSGSIDADNAGSRYTGAQRLGLTLNINNPSGNGDVFTVRALASAHAGLKYGRFAYQRQFGQAKAGIAYTALAYTLGDAFAGLGAQGTATIASVYASYALRRSRASNLYLQVDYDDKRFDDRQALTGGDNPKRVRVLMLSVDGDRRGARGRVKSGLTVSLGRVDLDSTVGLALDAAGANVNGAYAKLAMDGSWQHELGAHAYAFARLTAQLASHNLDLSEQMELGGANAVRAYAEGQAYADEACVLNLELRRELPRSRLPGAWQGVLFYDRGSARLHKDAFSNPPDTRTLSGAGLGVNWVYDARFVLKAYWAHRLGQVPASFGSDASSRFWIQAVQYF